MCKNKKEEKGMNNNKKAPCMREPKGVIANDAIQLFLDCANPEKGKAFNEKTLEEKVDMICQLFLKYTKL